MTEPFQWGLASLRARPARYAGVVLVIFVRFFMALFHLGAGINKLRNGWAWTDYLEGVFTDRLAELMATGAQTYGPFYLENIAIPYLKYFALPLYWPVAVVVTVFELAAGLGFLTGFATRWAGAMALFLMINFAIGGYYDASLIPLALMVVLIIVTPSGHWWGLDRRMAVRYPTAAWFK